MYKFSTSVESLHRVVAMLVAIAVLAWSVGAYSSAQAANLTSISDTLTDSNATSTSNHTLVFTVPTSSPGVVAGGTITVAFPAGFNVSSILFTDVDLNIAGSDMTIVSGAPGATASWGYSISGQTITLTSGSAAAAVTAGQVVRIKIGTNATVGATGTHQVTNPGVGSYEFVVTAGVADTGRTRVAILSNVLVTASVDTSFIFTVTGLATSTNVNGTSTTGSSSATAIPFGTLTAGVPKTLGQQLNVTTNARNGFVVTVQQNQNLLSSTGADIDGFIDGAYTNTPTAWVSPSNNINNENTWGHWGLNTDDADLNAQVGGGVFASSTYVAASTTPRNIFAHTGPADGTTQNIGVAKIGYTVQITPLQEAGNDYSTILTYIATPTF
jgi:hypothetical protein